MSALAGLVRFASGGDAGDSCRRMLAAQRLYGPHDSRLWRGEGVALGRNLFRLLPEDAFDRQPVAGGGGRFRLVADLRLDNRDELSDALGLERPRARRLADADLLLLAWERWEEQVFERLLGDYAFALWDATERRLVLARDPLGQRPLHYHRNARFLAFASMPKGLHALPEVPRAPDEGRVAEFAALLPEAGPRSFFSGIERVEPGQVVTICSGRIATRWHWAPDRSSLPAWPGGDAVEALREQLDRAVAARLRGAKDEVAAHLSGGLDSAAVASSAARLLGDAGRIVAFTAVPRAGYDGPEPDGGIGDEGPLAAATAALYPNIEHVLVRLGQGGLIERLDRAFFLHERPTLNACNLEWWDAINDRARERGLSVLLTGGLGNATISYDGSERLAELAATGRWLSLMREGCGLVRKGHARWRGVLGAAVGPWLPDRLWRAARRREASPAGLAGHSMVHPELRAALSAEGRRRGLDVQYRPRRNGLESRLWLLRRVDLGNSYKGILGGWGIDTRDPTADRRLIEFCLSLPMHCYLEGGEPRSLAMRALADRLPHAVLAERRKGIQAIDWHESLSASRAQLGEEIERLSRIPQAAATLDLPRMRNCMLNWPEQEWHRPAVTATYRLGLLRGAVNGHFLRRAVGSNA